MSKENDAHIMTLNEFAGLCHWANKRWWHDPTTGEAITRNKGEMIALMHSEISEALEGIRKNLMDDKIPTRKAEEVELVDLLIRVFDYAGGFGLDLSGAFKDKMEYNSKRIDHTHEHRRQQGGKAF